MSYRTIETVEGSPTFAALNPNTSKIYISYESPDLILIVNIKKGEIEDKISANHAGDINIASSANKVYVSAADGVYEIDGSTNEYNLINKKPEISSQHLGIQDSPSSFEGAMYLQSIQLQKKSMCRNMRTNLFAYITGINQIDWKIL